MVCDLIRTSTRIATLDVSGNPEFGIDDAIAVATAVSECHSDIQAVHFTSCGITAQGWCQLLWLLRSAAALYWLISLICASHQIVLIWRLSLSTYQDSPHPSSWTRRAVPCPLQTSRCCWDRTFLLVP